MGDERISEGETACDKDGEEGDDDNDDDDDDDEDADSEQEEDSGEDVNACDFCITLLDGNADARVPAMGGDDDKDDTSDPQSVRSSGPDGLAVIGRLIFLDKALVRCGLWGMAAAAAAARFGTTW